MPRPHSHTAGKVRRNRHRPERSLSTSAPRLRPAWAAANALGLIRAGSRWEFSDETFYWKMLIHRHQNVSWKCTSFYEFTRKPRHYLDVLVTGRLPGYPMASRVCLLAGQMCPPGCSRHRSLSSAKASDGPALVGLLAALNTQHEMGWGHFVLLRSYQVQQGPWAATASPPWKGGKKVWSLSRNIDGCVFSKNDDNPSILAQDWQMAFNFPELSWSGTLLHCSAWRSSPTWSLPPVNHELMTAESHRHNPLAPCPTSS